MANEHARLPGSFRDPSGFVFVREGVVYRQINKSYRAEYEQLMSSGLYDELVGDGLLLRHTEVGPEHALTDDVFEVIRPKEVPFISYPYEWCFGQLKQAALLTLEVQERAFGRGMSLKDCSAYNVQFVDGEAVFIDTLSFEKYREGRPWTPYRQFCQHFLAPLALMSYVDVRLHRLLRVHLDGIPLDLASTLLPARSWINFGLLSHIHMHAKAQQRFSDSAVSSDDRSVGRMAFLGLVDGLKSTVKKLTWRPGGTEWHDYYDISNYTTAALESKKQLVSRMLDEVKPAPESVWDLGANEGLFSRIASERGCLTVAFDVDPAAVEENHQEVVKRGETHLLPLVLDLTNPSPGIGWENRERASLIDRGPADVVLALALIHHLAISNNLPFGKIARFLSRLCCLLIIEFVPKRDSQVQKLLSSRVDVFAEYEQESFEREFGRLFDIRRRERIPDTERTLYLMTKPGA